MAKIPVAHMPSWPDDNQTAAHGTLIIVKNKNWDSRTCKHPEQPESGNPPTISCFPQGGWMGSWPEVPVAHPSACPRDPFLVSSGQVRKHALPSASRLCAVGWAAARGLWRPGATVAIAENLGGPGRPKEVRGMSWGSERTFRPTVAVRPVVVVASE